MPEFVYFAVEICHRATLPSATLNFSAGKIFANWPKHQTRCRAWVGQADFRTVELKNRNHSGNCQRLSVKHKTRSSLVSVGVFNSRSFAMDQGRYFYNPSHMQGYYGDSADCQQYFPFYHSMQSGETLPNTLQVMPQLWTANTPQASVSQVSVLHVSTSQAGSSQASQTRSSAAGSSTSSSFPSSPEASDQPGKQAYNRWSNDEEKMLINLWAKNQDRINSSQARKAWDEIGKQIFI